MYRLNWCCLLEPCFLLNHSCKYLTFHSAFSYFFLLCKRGTYLSSTVFWVSWYSVLLCSNFTLCERSDQERLLHVWCVVGCCHSWNARHPNFPEFFVQWAALSCWYPTEAHENGLWGRRAQIMLRTSVLGTPLLGLYTHLPTHMCVYKTPSSEDFCRLSL